MYSSTYIIFSGSLCALVALFVLLRLLVTMLVLLIGLGFVVVAISLILYARWNFGVLESLGITVVKPLHPILGNTYNFHKKITHLEDVKRFKKYGPVFGVYEGREAQVHICDSELIKHVMVKDYEHFSNRRVFDFGSPLLNEFPDFLKDEKWKIVRHLLTPNFTLFKIKTMSVSMVDSLIEYEDILKAKISSSQSGVLEKYNLDLSIVSMLTDMIMRCVFSITTDKQKEDSNKYFVQVVKHAIEGDGGAENIVTTFMKSLSFSFPFLNRFVQPIFGTKASDDFVKTYKQILNARRKSGVKMNDFVDQTIEWLDRLETPEFKTNGITELTIFCQAIFFFFAGQDQIDSFVTHTVLNVCKNKKIENAVYAEMDKFLEKHDGKINHDNVSELVYLQACINESYRLVPHFIRAERICTKDWEKDGVKIKKGVNVIIPLWAANRNPDYFPDPETYDPERFMPENKDKLHPCGMSTFGHGPKNCVGMKFANEISILTAAHLFKSFRFKARPDSERVFYPGVQMLATFQPCYFDVSLR